MLLIYVYCTECTLMPFPCKCFIKSGEFRYPASPHEPMLLVKKKRPAHWMQSGKYRTFAEIKAKYT